MQRGYFKSKILNPQEIGLLKMETPIMSRKVHKSKRLTLHEKIKVVYAVLIEHEYQAIVAK